jgi:hypothetical protein
MYIFQQDGATSRTSKVTQEHLDEEVPEFIKKDEWPPQSPDCNHIWIIMCMWDSLSEKVYRGSTDKFTKKELKQRITECWEEISLAELRKSIRSWKERLRAVCGEDGGPTNRSSFRLD